MILRVHTGRLLAVGLAVSVALAVVPDDRCALAFAMGWLASGVALIVCSDRIRVRQR